MKFLLKLLLPAIFILAVLLRVYKLDTVPPSLFGDEIDVGYQAYSILHTGRDLSGRFLPFYVKSLSEYRTPLYIYCAVPFVAVFGLNEWGVRLPAAFWGVLSIIGFYLLVKKLTNKKLATIAAFLMTVSPWHLQYSRASFEVTMLLTFIIFGIFFFLLSRQKIFYLYFSAILFGLSVYIYSTAIVFVPLLVISLVILDRSYFFNKTSFKNNLKVYLFTFITLILISLPLIYSTYSGVAKERFSIISIFQESVLLDKLNIARRGQEYFSPDGVLHKINPAEEIFFHNKLIVFGQVFAQNYLHSLSADFLFTSGDPNFRQSIFEMGQLYIYELFLILIGIFYLIVKIEKNKKLFVLSWLLIAPIPSALTTGGGYHATRLILMLPPLLILASLGFLVLTKLKNLKIKRILVFGILILALFNYVFYFHRYYVHYPIESWRWWHSGFKEALTEVNSESPNYNKIIINNTYEPSLTRYLYYSKYDPSKFHEEFTTDKMTTEVLPGVMGFNLNNKISFGYLTEAVKKEGGFESIMKPGMLYMASARDEANGDLRTYPHKNFIILKTIVNPKNEPIFYILAGKK